MEIKLKLLLILGIIGLAIAGYLVYSRNRYHSVKVCPTGGGWNTVLNSKYSKTFGMRNDILGMIYYTIIIIEFFLLTALMTNLIIHFKIITSLALLFSIYLFYIQAAVLKQYCFYCVSAGIVNVFIFGIIITL